MNLEDTLEDQGAPEEVSESDQDDESIEEMAGIADTSEEEPDDPEPQITQPPEAPPLPEEGLPPGWSMEQWRWYGARWLESKKE